MDFSKYNFHPSSAGLIMTEARSKSEGLGETCKQHLLECWVKERYGREREIQTKYMEKGLMVEEDSITLFSRVSKTIFFKNKETISNLYLTGTPDLFVGDHILKAKEVIDLKSSWDIFTFFKPLTTTINKMYYWQLQGYMDLTGAPVARLAYCLIDTPDTLIADEKRRLAYQMGLIDADVNQDYINACAAIDKAMTFGDIPIEERVIEFEIVRNQEDIDKLHKRVSECREWLTDFDRKQMAKLKLAA